MSRLRRHLLAALLLAPLAASTATANPPVEHRGEAVARALADTVTPRAQSEVLVLGFWHTAAFKEMEPRHLESTLERLDRYAPTQIAVESLPPDEIALLLEQRDHSEAARWVLDTFGKRIVENGAPMQKHLGTDRATAAGRMEALLAEAGPEMAADARTELVGQMLAAYEYDSAVLQWSYLNPEQRQAAGLPETVRTALDEELQSKRENVIVALELARRHGLQRIHPIDSQYEVIRTLGFPQDVIDDVFANPAQAVWREGPQMQRVFALPERALEAGDLLGLVREVNSPDVLEVDAGQWRSWLTMDHPSGLDRFRYAMWEQRNLRMASAILDAAASTQPERVLVVVGFSHKAYLDRELATKLSLKLRQFEEFDTSAAGAAEH
ncbi:DUF5694 domain-containing protein [Luteimonas suaedae]|uniref:DUF5694 domain-containing protein n=1 Tax=Luteimonas suaedae TaxID=2605430 RepID=UPI0011EF994E|nr:DUF5694 domain-containing protein [Luteimonas suaedae]